MKKNIIICVLAVFGSSHIVLAEGIFPAPTPQSSGIYGANRRVITNAQGFNGIRGSFSVPTIRIPTNFYAPPLIGLIIADGNSANSKPGFYLGCKLDPDDGTQNQLDVDAGVIYEPRLLPRNENGSIKRIPPGYTVFINTKGTYAPNGVHTGAMGWRATVGGGANPTNSNVTQFDLTWRVYRPRAYGNIGPFLPYYGGYLQVNAIGADEQPTDEFGEMGRIYARGSNDTERICDSTAGMRVKRVIAINQGGGDGGGLTPGGAVIPARRAYLPTNGIYENDGSYMRNSVFSGISGQTAGQALFEGPVYGPYDIPTAWYNLSSTFVGLDEVETGYYPGGSDQTVSGSTRSLSTALPHFSFPEIPVALWNSEGDRSRYDTERVNINLRNARPSRGKQISAGRVAGWTIE